MTKVKTRIPNPYETVHDLQQIARTYPDAAKACDAAITVILVLNDKRAASLACLNDVEWGP